MLACHDNFKQIKNNVFLKHKFTISLTLIWVDFSGVRFEVGGGWGGGGGKNTPCQKHVRIMLET